MSFDGLEKTPEVAPLLVRLYDTHNLYSLAGEKGSDDARMELATIMTDLLKVKLSEREKELIADVILGLMKQAERDLRAALSERLAAMDNVPLRVVLGLANDSIEVADPVLRQSPLLQDLDLIYILQSKGVEHGRSIAHRDNLTAHVIDALADTKDFQIAVNLSNNSGAKLTRHAFQIFSDMARNHDDLAAPLLSRPDVPREVAGKLYEFVGDELKAALKKKYGIDSKDAMSAIDGIVLEMSHQKPETYTGDFDYMMRYARNMEQRGELKIPAMVANLRRGQNASFLTQFAVFCNIPVDSAKKAVCEESGRMLACVCRALGVSKGEYVSLYLLTDKFRHQSRKVINHKELSGIMMMYDDIHSDDAKLVLNKLRH